MHPNGYIPAPCFSGGLKTYWGLIYKFTSPLLREPDRKLICMNFNSVNYMIFLPIVVMGRFAVPKKFKNTYLLFVSYYFYFCAESRFFLLLPFLTAITWFMGILLDRAEKNRGGIFCLALALNLGTLIFFKYNKFFLNIFQDITGIGYVRENWFLPMGLSFYTFMAVSYLADIYLKKYRRCDNLRDFAVYISFFPHVLMGPIDRRDKFLPQLKEERKFDYDRFRRALQLMALGFFKKIAVADMLAKFIDRVHLDLYSYTGAMLIFTAVMYSFQLYADFSGYCDIARASGMMLGFDLAENFSTPYLSTSFSQFWSRWHITLSNWFQDYIFTPVVWTNPFKKLPVIGKFFEKPPVLPAVAMVFIASGIWHGSTWNFVIWGLCHAVYRIGEELMRRYYKKPDKHPRPLKFWGKVVWVFSLVTFSQIFFRSKDIPAALYYIAQVFTNVNPSAFISQYFAAVGAGFDYTPILIYGYSAFCALTLGIMIYMDFVRCFRLKGKCLTNRLDGLKPVVRWVCYWGLIGLIMAGFIMNNGGFGASASFIYNGF